MTFESLCCNARPDPDSVTGDYPHLRRLRGRDDALASFIGSLSHEVVHYIQWIEMKDVNERGVVRKARSMLDRYALEVDHP